MKEALRPGSEMTEKLYSQAEVDAAVSAAVADTRAKKLAELRMEWDTDLARDVARGHGKTVESIYTDGLALAQERGCTGFDAEVFAGAYVKEYTRASLAYQARCLEIYKSGEAQGRTQSASYLITNTEMSAADAIAILSKMPLDRVGRSGPARFGFAGSNGGNDDDE